MAMSVPFTGVFFHAVDSKSRLTIPSKLRDVIHPREQTCAFYVVAEYDKALHLYTPEQYREQRPRFGPADLADEDVRSYRRMYYGLTEYAEVDRLGRVLLPEHLLKLCGIDRNVAIVGADDHVEVWDEGRWREWIGQRFAQRDELAARVSRRLKAPAAVEPAAPAEGGKAPST